MAHSVAHPSVLISSLLTHGVSLIVCLQFQRGTFRSQVLGVRGYVGVGYKPTHGFILAPINTYVLSFTIFELFS